MASRYTDKELTAISELRRNLKDLNLEEENKSDEYLIKFLKAQHFDIPNAEEMLRKSLEWRKNNDIDSIHNWIPPVALRNAFPFQICGYDEEGNAIVLRLMKHSDISLFTKVDKDDLIKYRIQNLEKVLVAMRQRNAPLGLLGNQVISIVDLEGFNMRSLLSSKVVEVLKAAAVVEEANYPELSKQVFVIHAPRILTLAMSVVKYVVPKSTMSKTKIYGSDMQKWSLEILQHVPSAHLPPKYGGTNLEFEITNGITNCV